MKLIPGLSILLLLFVFNLPASAQDNRCTFCGGRGTVDCINCGGAAQYTCNQCGGNGGRWEICNCNNGYVTMPDGSTQRCNYCEGEGRKWHTCYNPNCGNGQVHCNFCGGSVQKTCGTCNGSRQK